MAPFGPASTPLLSPTVREAGVARVQCTLRRPGAASASSSSSPPASPEAIPCDVPLIADLVRTGAVPLPNLVFCGWRKPDREWKTWVKTMAREDKFVKVWQAAGIQDAILNSTVNIRKASWVMPALVGFWCASTSTFVLPWGEVGFTLEDAHMLSNLPVWGSPLQRLLTEEEKRLKLRLAEVWDNLPRLMQKSGIRATMSCSSWLNWFVKMEGRGDDELLHLGFLAYWLSRFVIPSEPLHQMSSAVFEIAARLCRGERIALAPAVTANLYSDLTTITKLLYECQGRKIKIEVWGLFRLLQAWLWERFDCLSPKKQNSIIQQSAVRIARWDNKVNNLTTYPEAHQAFYDPRCFDWRPYTKELRNWVKPKWYTREEQLIAVDEQSPMWVYDILAIVSAAGLVGLVSEDFVPTGQYKPDRVAMQLGYDQFVPTSTIPLVMPWDSSTVCPLGLEFYVPSMTRKCSTIKEYSKWWEDYTMSYDGTVLRATGCGLKEQMSNKRKMDCANNEDNDGNNMKKRRLSGDLKSEDCRQKRECNPGEKHKISGGHRIIEVLDGDEASDVVIITKDQQGEGLLTQGLRHTMGAAQVPREEYLRTCGRLERDARQEKERRELEAELEQGRQFGATMELDTKQSLEQAQRISHERDLDSVALCKELSDTCEELASKSYTWELARAELLLSAKSAGLEAVREFWQSAELPAEVLSASQMLYESGYKLGFRKGFSQGFRRALLRARTVGVEGLPELDQGSEEYFSDPESPETSAPPVP